eukprot:5749044-Alexandrium_andersonii.AAC.1
MSASLVGSEMCIRDRKRFEAARNCWNLLKPVGTVKDPPLRALQCRPIRACLLYTSDAADDM